jgi:hypothetical protein
LLEDVQGDTECVQTLLSVKTQITNLKKANSCQPAHPAPTPTLLCTRQPPATAATPSPEDEEDPIEDADSILARQVDMVAAAAAKKAGK